MPCVRPGSPPSGKLPAVCAGPPKDFIVCPGGIVSRSDENRRNTGSPPAASHAARSTGLELDHD